MRESANIRTTAKNISEWLVGGNLSSSVTRRTSETHFVGLKVADKKVRVGVTEDFHCFEVKIGFPFNRF